MRENTLGKDTKARELLTRHKTLTKAEVREQFTAHEERKKNYATDAVACEKALEAFNQILDPLVDPSTDNCLCWVRRPTQEELEALIPEEFMAYRNNPEEVPASAIKGQEDVMFEMMEALIAVPKKTSKEWKGKANLVFQRLFQMHIQQVLDDLGITVRNF